MPSNTSGTCSLPTHPRTGLQAIGIGKRGPIWPVMGGSAPAGEAPPVAPPTGAPDATPASTAPPTGQAPAAPPVAPATVDDLPDWAQKIVRDARAEAAGSRTAAKTAADTAAEQAKAEMAQTIGKALGLIAGDEPADPNKLTEQLSAAQSAARDNAVQLAVYRAAPKAGADPDSLLDSRSFLNALTDIDPDDAAAVTAAIAEAIKTNPKLKVGQAPGASGVDHSGGSGEGAHTLDAQIAEATKAGNHGLAIALKRQAAATT